MRLPAVAGRFYPAGREALVEAIETCFTHPLGPGMPGPSTDGRMVRGIMVPHAGYMISGPNAEDMSAVLDDDGDLPF